MRDVLAYLEHWILRSKKDFREKKIRTEQVISKRKADEDQVSYVEARLAAAREQAQSAQEEAQEWTQKLL
ncbi:hypothetical protein GBA52_007199 [Prunus armeniaca]|nr:hypothetical protein GBA52_007199 [Prunus armeniaca]